jgi:hypothetical protein
VRLQVRMGIATGQLLKGQDIAQSGVVDLAKAVSDMGGGGQVLLDERTFADVKERLRELGAVDAAGIDWKSLTSGRSFWSWLTCRWVGTASPRCSAFASAPAQPHQLLGRRRFPLAKCAISALPVSPCRPVEESRSGEEALCLDMGQYSLLANLTASGARRTIAMPGSLAGPQPNPGGMLSLSGLAFWSRAIRGNLRVGCSDARPEQLRLFQLLPPALAGRAKTFGKALRADMACTDMPYFDAPGTLVAPLGLEAFLPQDMPEVSRPGRLACWACWCLMA